MTTGIRWLTLLVAISLGAPAPGSDPLPGAGDGTDLWLIRAAADERFDVLHRVATEPPGQLRLAKSMRGRLVRGGCAAGGGRLWLVYDNLSVHSLTAIAPADTGTEPSADADQLNWRYRLSVEAGLPRGLTVQSLATNHAGLWALVRVELRETLEALDHVEGNEDVDPDTPAGGTAGLPGSEATPAGGATGLPGSETTPAGGATRLPGSEATPAGGATGLPGELPGVRLIRLEGSRWVKVELPADWPGHTRAWLVSVSGFEPRPRLVTLAAGDGADASSDDELIVTVYRDRSIPVPDHVADPDWQSARYRVPRTERGADVRVLAVDGQVVLGQVHAQPAEVEAALWVLRGGEALGLGTLRVEGATVAGGWAILPVGADAALVTRDAVGRLSSTTMDLTGKVRQRDMALFEWSPNRLGMMAEYLVLVGVLMVATLVLFVFWRRDPAWNKLELPAQWSLAGLPTRAAAGAIDLAPCLFLVASLYRLSPRLMLSQWWSLAGGWEALEPRLVVIGLFVLHTTLGELFTARTLGKSVMGLRVMALSGREPNLWQVAARNLFKALELLAPFLLVLPMLAPNQQRLGDLVGRTVVACPGAASPDDDDSDPERP